MTLITSRPKIKTTVDGLPLAYQLFTEGNYVPIIIEVERTTITDDLTNTVVTFSASGANGEYYVLKSSDFPAQISLISITEDRIKALVKLVKEDTLFFLDSVIAFKYSVGLKSDLGLMELESGFFNVNPSLTLGKGSQAPTPDAPAVIELTAPKPGDKLFVGKAFRLLAKASDQGGGIERVDFYANGIKIATNKAFSVKGVWDFSYVPTQAGSVTFYAVATDTSGYSTKSNAVATNVEPEPIVPTANFSFVPLTGSAPLSVTFVNTSVNAATYVWDFGDGTAVSSAIAPVHIFEDSGNYTISLVATNQYGSVSITKDITVAVAVNQPPIVSITNPANSSSITAGQQITLTATASDDEAIAAVQFRVNGVDVGMAKTAPPYTQAWTPATTGNHTITAIATDNLGVSTTSNSVFVNAVSTTTSTTSTTTAPGTTTTTTPPTFNRVFVFASSSTGALQDGSSNNTGCTANSQVSPNTQFRFNELTTRIGTPSNMTIHLGGVAFLSFNYPNDYEGKPFVLVGGDGTVFPSRAITAGRVDL